MLSGFSSFLSSTAASVGKTVQSTVHDVTGPKALQDFELGDQVGSGGPGMLWKLYKATPISEAKKKVMPEVCVWYLDKKSLADERAKSGTSKAAEDSLLDIFRADAKVIQKLRHPGIVRVVEPLDESKWAMAMVTEPIFSSVSNALGNLENLSSIPPELEKLELGQLEIKHGLMQLAEALSFIHRNARLIHRGISPESVYITTNGGWKFAGFGFSTMAEEHPGGDEPSFMYPDFDVDYPVLPLQPPLDYTAPELTRPLPISARGGGLDARLSVDLFSLGLLTYHLQTKHPLLRCSNNLETYQKRVMMLRNLPFNDIPMDLEPELRRMLNPDPQGRPTASDFAASRYFTEDMRLKALQFIDQMIGRGNDQRAEFLNSLQGIWAGFDSRVLRFKVLPALLNELKNPATQLLALPWVLEVVEVQDPKDFQVRSQELLIPAMEAAHGELLLLFLRHMPALVTKASPDLMTSHLLPMMMRAFEDADPRLQEETLRRSIALVPKLDFELVKQAILPRVHMLALRTSVAAVRVQALVSLGELVPTLDKPCVMDILQTMARCAAVDHSPPTLMCIVGVCDVIQKEYGMEFAAQHILPLLTPLLTVQQLSNGQFARFLKLIMDILTRLQDKRGVSLSEADSVSLDLASMGLSPSHDEPHPSSQPKPELSSWNNNSDGWGGIPSNSNGGASSSSSASALPPMSDPFASMPPIGGDLFSSSSSPGPTAVASSYGGIPMGASSSFGGMPLGGPSMSASAIGGQPMSSSAMKGPPPGGVSAGGGPMPDMFSSSSAAPHVPSSTWHTPVPAPAAHSLSPPKAANADPFAMPSSIAPSSFGSGMGSGLGSGMGSGMGSGLGSGGNLGFSPSPIGGATGFGLPSSGMGSIVPDKAPPEDDPFADWPPRKPSTPPNVTSSNTSAMPSLNSTNMNWGNMNSTQQQPMGMSHTQQPMGGRSAPLRGPSASSTPASSMGSGFLAPPPAPSQGFSAFPPPPGPKQQQPWGGGFSASPELHAGGAARPPSEPLDLL